MSDVTGWGFDQAVFEVPSRADGSRFLRAVTDDFMPDYGKRHPVVVWASQPANEAEAVAWFAAQVAA